MLRNRRAILPLLAVIFILFFDLSVSAQCGAGKIPMTVQGFGSILTVNAAFSNGAYSLGAPNGNGANFSSGGQFIVIDLIDTVRAGQTYSITWRQYPGEAGTSVLNWSESIDGSLFTVHPSSGIGTTNERYFTTDISAATDTRYIRIFTTDNNDINVDAISYYATKCFSDICEAGFNTQFISGYGSYTTQANVNNPAYANFVPDGLGANFNSGFDRQVIRFQHTLQTGQNYFIIWRPSENNASMKIRESVDGSSWSAVKTVSSATLSSIFILHTETAGTATKYIEISSAGNQDFFLDAVIFNAVNCQPAAPDLDVTGSYEFCGSPVQIAPGLIIADPSNQIISSAYVQFWDGFVPAEDRLSCTDDNGITSSYNATYGVLSLTGEATTSEYQSVLRSLLYNNINGAPTTGTREIIISLERYNPITGHYYIFVPSPSISWPIARLQAGRTRLFGLQGYLVTVTSDAENNFLLYQMNGNSWLGGSDFYTNEGDWYWMTGPEAGTMFWQGNETGTELTYANWNPGTEPNNYTGIDEVFAHIYPPGSTDAGTWNDERANFTAAAYYVEFGDMPGDPAIDINGVVNVNVVTGTPLSPSITGSNSVCPNATAVTYTTTNVPGHNYLWVVTGGTIISGQGSNSITVDWGSTNPGTVRLTESIGGACSVTTPDYSVFIGDITDPTITCPANVTNVPANAGQCYATGVALGTPTTADNCGVATVTNNAPVQFPVGTTTVIWTVTDNNGRTATCNQTVTVVDTQNPTITCPANVTNVPANAGQCYATGVALGTPTTADNCGVSTVTNNAPVQFPVGTTTVIWTVTDNNGRTATCNQTVTVVDTQNPTITCPANVTNVPANAGQCYATGVALGTPTTADNCGVATVTNNAPVQFPVGTTTVIWTVTDNNGRTATCNQTVTVVDTQNPTITCPANVTNVPANAGQCYATGVALGTPTTADNCGVSTVTNNAPVQFPVGTTTVIWTVTDNNGRTATCNQTVTVVDTQNPTITCPANVTNVPANAGQCYATGVALGTPTTADNCGVSTVTNNAPVQFPVGTTTVIWTVTDNNGTDGHVQPDSHGS